MKISISSQGWDLDSRVDPRFGRAAQFLIYDTEASSFEVVSNSQSLNAMQGAGIKAAEVMSNRGVQVLITGHCGPKAFNALKAAGIEVISSAHNLNQGGAGLVIYRTSEDCRQTGVQVGDDFFPGYSGYYQDPQIQMAFIGLDYRQGPGTPITVKAVDEAGNEVATGLRHYIQKKAFKNDTVRISDQFITGKLPEFEDEIPPESSGSLVDKFLKINRDLREADYQKIAQLVETTTPVKQWEGPFLRMPGSANEAGFADHRVYQYNDKTIDRQVHLGVDLASTTHAPVPAANNGIVVFSGLLGIYGRTILIDHGFGLFSMYSHLSRSDVSKGQHVSKGEILGRTGSTGLAGGDHLHFSILVNKTFVNPIEWWDAAWIENNILSKIEAVAAVPAHK